jgi:hypothetical protein
MVVAGIEINDLSLDEARDLASRLQWHIQCEEASMTPAELHEHLREMPDQLGRELLDLHNQHQRELLDTVENYVVRRGNWESDECCDEYTDEDGYLNREAIVNEFLFDICRLADLARNGWED